METTGNINSTYNEHTMEWLIPNFISLPAEDSKYYDSPPFSFRSAVWYLKIYPNGNKAYNSIGHLTSFLCKRSGPEINLDFSLSLKNLHGTTEKERQFIYAFKKFPRCGFDVISRSELLTRKSELLTAGILTVVCKMKCKESEEYVDDGSLSEDFQKMLEDGSNRDLILKIGDKEIRVHKDVLRARSQVFKSMLEHDMKEKNSGIIDVPDCDPQAMEVFLSYVYSGKVEALQENNMLQLYYIADKYEMAGLKNKCCIFIKRSLSSTNFCDVIQLAWNHSDTALFDFATDYFNSNALDILQTVEWQNFLKDKFYSS